MTGLADVRREAAAPGRAPRRGPLRRGRPTQGAASPWSGATRLSSAAATILAVACAGGPSAETGPTPALPEIPEARGELRLYVAYPDRGDPIAATDSNFVFGTTGTGAAELTIDGRPVEVRPNGAFLAWLPVPERTAGDTARYRLVARADGRVDSLEHPVRLPPRPYGEEGVRVDTAALSALAERWGPPEATVEHTIRAAPGLRAWLEVRPSDGAGAPGGARARARALGLLPGDLPPALRFPLEETAPGRYRFRAPIGLLAVARPAPAATAVPDTVRLTLRATDGRDTTAARGGLALRLLEPRRPPVGTLAEEPDSVHGAAGSVPGRPSPRGSYAWLLPPGSAAPVDARIGDRVRLRLGPDLHAWIAAEDLRIGPPEPLAAGPTDPVAPVGLVSAEPLGDRLRIRVPVGRRLPARVEVSGPRTLRLVVHGGTGATERVLYGRDDPLLEALRWRQEAGPRWTLDVRLSRPVWGWDLRWEDVGRPAGDGPADVVVADELPRPDESGVLVLDVRRPPEIDPDEPLRGVRVAVDPGHPPVGAEGPTGLTEAEANLGVARQLARLLAEEGAEPVLVREDDAAVGLYERRDRARGAAADVLISVHNNALPDGVRPFGREGTSTYYFHLHARRLAREVQRGMLRAMGLRDLGLRWGNLALPREPWMPTVLTEGAFMMFPRHEAALRTEAFREAYARGVVEGLRRFLGERGAGRGAGS